MSSQFSRKEVPHFAGHLTGIRALEIYPDGVLHSPQRHFMWRKGENIARCPRQFGAAIGTDRRVAIRDCVCGFYAYFSAPWADTYMPFTDGVYAVVKAYGRITYGDYGFRAEKMQILAVAPRFPLVDDGFPRPLQPKFNGWPSYLLLVTGAALGVFSAAFGNDLPLWMSIAGLLTGFATVALSFYLGRRAMARYRKALKDWEQQCVEWSDQETERRYQNKMSLPEDWINECRKRYPRVAWFNNLDTMLAEFPLTGRDALP